MQQPLTNDYEQDDMTAYTDIEMYNEKYLDKAFKKDKNEFKDVKRINQERKAQREFKRGWK